ncbi:MAG TPA: hypothetical protein PKW52_04015 [Nitrospira sp.]|nr:hypothetical protein [Nitrospira sp.]HQV10477.1 hypothetical protein [Nitrospira sp.]
MMRSFYGAGYFSKSYDGHTFYELTRRGRSGAAKGVLALWWF